MAPIDHYPDLLLETLRASSPATTAEPTVVVLTPGMYNSAYFEHAFLAQQMGVELVEGQDLFVKDGFVYMRTTRGPKRVDVIYRRVDDDFLDPSVFRPGSTLGCAGLLDVYRSGHVSISATRSAPAWRTTKSIYPYVPKMIEFYLGEKPILNNVPTYHVPRQGRPRLHAGQPEGPGGQGGARRRRLRHAGGAGRHPGPRSRTSARRWWPTPAATLPSPRSACRAAPRLWRAASRPRHIDLRPYVLSGKEVQMVPGGLTRVALKEARWWSNSSQGGGTKDTWILEDPTRPPPAPPKAQSQSQSQSWPGGKE